MPEYTPIKRLDCDADDCDAGTGRRLRLETARLYLVCDSAPGGRELADVLRPAITGGVQIVQLRDKRLSDDELTAVARPARALCERLGVLFIVNDRPAVAVAAGADGVHVGQDDMPVAEVRALVGPDMLIGLSTHTPAEIDAAMEHSAMKPDRSATSGPATLAGPVGLNSDLKIYSNESQRQTAGGRLHRGGPRPRDSDEAGTPGGGPGSRAPCGGARPVAILRDRRYLPREHGCGAQGRRPAHSGRARDHRGRGPWAHGTCPSYDARLSKRGPCRRTAGTVA